MRTCAHAHMRTYTHTQCVCACACARTCVYACVYGFVKSANWGAICVFRQKCSTGTSLEQKSTKNTQKHQKCIVFKKNQFYACTPEKRQNNGQFALFAKNVLQGRLFSKSQQKTHKIVRNVFISNFFHFHACMSKNGEMACNLRFSPKMFYKDAPSVKVNKKHKKTS